MRWTRIGILATVAAGVVGVSVVAITLLAIPRAGDRTPTGSAAPGLDGSPTGSIGPAARQDDVRLATILESVPLLHVPGGPPITDEFGEQVLRSPVGRRVTVVETRTLVDGGWARVYVHVDPNEAPGDLYAWLPVAADGRPVLAPDAQRTCPDEMTLESIAELTPFERVACAGDRELTLDVRVGFQVDYVSYRVDPAFLGGYEGDGPAYSVSPMVDKLVLFPSPTTTPTFDVVVAPGTEPPPIDFDVRLTGSFAHPAAATCRRTVQRLPIQPPPPAGAGLPEEAPPDSAAWCRTRFVVTGWDVLRGPERRAPVSGEVQLHRTIAGGGCGGVGMEGPLTLRIDPGQADPVWIDLPGGGRSLPMFPASVRYRALPAPALVTAQGLVLTDGATFDPDAGFPGLPSCPGGAVIAFG